MRKFPAKAAAVAYMLFSGLAFSPAAQSSPVLLSFDVETPGDEVSLEKLDPGVPATYFVTGRFAIKHKEFVRGLSDAGNTIGSHSDTHPHFRKINDKDVLKDIAGSKQTIESITGKPVIWFRSPYLEYDQRTLRTLKSLGFTGDSSDKETWALQSVIDELPISDFKNEDLIASDYDMIDEDHFTEEAYDVALRKLYLQKEASGQPVVILAHPAVSVKYPDVYRRFVRFVNERHGTFMTFDSFRASVQKNRVTRTAAWAEPAGNLTQARKLAASISATGATDVCLRTGPGELRGRRAVLLRRTIAVLKSKGLRVHALISPLCDRQAVKKHPDWAMCGKNGDPSTELLSPANPDAVAYMVHSALVLLGTFRFDGICLDNISYPNDEYDYSRQMLENYARAHGTGHLPTLSDLLNKEYNTWMSWRADVLSGLAATIGTRVHERWKGTRSCSAIVSGSSALDFHARETSGQNLALFAQSLDFLIPAIELPAESDNSEEADHLRRKLFALEIRAGKSRLMLPAGKCPATFERTPDTSHNPESGTP